MTRRRHCCSCYISHKEMEALGRVNLKCYKWGKLKIGPKKCTEKKGELLHPGKEKV